MTDEELAGCGGLPIHTAALLNRYAGMIRKWGRTQNLTALRDADAIAARHLLDALPLVRAVPANAAHIADIGSGAGSPGIPASICLPQARVTLVESRKKRAVFLRQCRIELGLDNVEVHHGRAEAWAPAQAPDVLVSRATAPLGKLARMTRHLFGPHTCMLVLKASDPQEEAARLIGLDAQVERVAAPGSGQERFVVRLRAGAEC